MNIKKHNNSNNTFLYFLYNTTAGRLLLKILADRTFSELCGAFLDSSLSRCIIPLFIRKNRIAVCDYEEKKYRSFNDFFVRRIKKEKRPVSYNPDNLIAPCDGLMSVYRITDKDTVIPAKQSFYSINDLLGNNPVARKYKNGICIVFRLCVDNYHRYCYIDNGKKGRNYFIGGKLHTVRPVALYSTPVFVQNCREYTIMSTENFGIVTQVEVGAMLVGKIHNNDECTSFKRGQEKGMFLYGGSTIILLLENKSAYINHKFFDLSAKGIEIPVKMGEVIGRREN